MAEGQPTVEEFTAAARTWLESVTTRRPADADVHWGAGDDRVSLFRDSTEEEEREQLEKARAWQRAKFDAGYGAIEWPTEYGGSGLSREHEVAYRILESEYVTPTVIEALTISVELEASTVRHLGTPAQQARWVRSLRRADEMCCQLFSEPGAGSDLGSMITKARVADGGWVINGQKVWSSGAQFADVGYLVARTDPDAPRQQALTAFLVPMDAPGVTVRPLRQMTGGLTFNEVFFDNVRIGDEARLGEVGAGWHAMMTTLAFERAGAASGLGFDGTELIDRLVLSAKHLGRDADPHIRAQVARIWSRNRMRNWLSDKAETTQRQGGIPGGEGSMLKLAYTQELLATADLAADLLGPTMVADTGEWGTYAWSAMAQGICGLRLGGGTDEIQRNTIAERVLGLPREAR